MYDAVVVGLGAAGSAALYQLARRGARVLGIDRHSPPHALGSSHGDTRITRKAIGEGDAYTPLALRSYAIWREIEAATGESLLTVTGGLWISSAARQAETHVANFFDNTVAAARRFGIAHEMLDAGAMRARFPQFAVRDNEVGYYEPDAGFLRPEACVAAQLRLAVKHGAEIRTNEAVERLEDLPAAKATLVCAGPWVREFLPPALARCFTVTRQVLYWFDVASSFASHAPPGFPVWIWELQDRRNVIYGFPAIDGPSGGLKLATEQYAVSTTPGSVEREVTEGEKRAMHADLVAPYLPGVGPRCVKAVACMYTSTPDFHFAIDRLPGREDVIVVSPCSGHGFKHSAAVGEALAQRALDGSSELDLSRFAFSRFAG